ncbi:unnamed protein product [Ambrosiozyma monospora]|uniref:Unnamed protein product n=1 Tax=Ambrosiozyma monospora TaxID=43982 RepID=A0ACB5T460_AMBMO|nr:unnamed protein product [Ambrosiozyma monospora]
MSPNNIKVKIEPTGDTTPTEPIVATSSPKSLIPRVSRKKATTTSTNKHNNMKTPLDRKKHQIDYNRVSKNGEKKKQYGGHGHDHGNRNHSHNSLGSGASSSSHSTAGSSASTNSSAKLSAFFVNLPDETTSTSNSISNVFMQPSKKNKSHGAAGSNGNEKGNGNGGSNTTARVAQNVRVKGEPGLNKDKKTTPGPTADDRTNMTTDTGMESFSAQLQSTPSPITMRKGRTNGVDVSESVSGSNTPNMTMDMGGGGSNDQDEREKQVQELQQQLDMQNQQHQFKKRKVGAV